MYTVRCPLLTLSLDEGEGVRLARQVDYRGVSWDRVNKVRIIVSKLPAWLEFTAQRESKSEGIVNIEALATSILLPAMASIPVPVTVYLFRDFQQADDNDLEIMKQLLRKGLARVDKELGIGPKRTENRYHNLERLTPSNFFRTISQKAWRVRSFGRS